MRSSLMRMRRIVSPPGRFAVSHVLPLVRLLRILRGLGSLFSTSTASARPGRPTRAPAAATTSINRTNRFIAPLLLLDGDYVVRGTGATIEHLDDDVVADDRERSVDLALRDESALADFVDLAVRVL